MEDMKLGVVESKFADIVWENEPLSTKELIVLCENHLQWKRTTTYTVLKKLCNKGIFKMEDSIVSAIISKEHFYSIQSEKFIEETFHGSLPAFITAFSKRRKLSVEELNEIRNIINELGV